MTKKAPAHFFGKYEQYLKWGALVILTAIAGVKFYHLPERLEAAEKEIIEIKEYTKASREEKKAAEDRVKDAPPGWQWSEVVGHYIEWREDPRLRKK